MIRNGTLRLTVWSVFLSFCGVAFGPMPGPCRADVFLPPAPITLGSGAKVVTYGANDAQPSAVVTDNGLNVGTAKFEYNTWSGTSAPPGSVFIGGAAFSGGFFVAPNICVPPGDVTAWVQLVTTSAPANNIWRPTAGVPYPDTGTNLEASPNYPHLTVSRLNGASNVTLPQPSVGIQDFPHRSPSLTAPITWSADTLLVLEDPVQRIATIMFGIRWGFTEVQSATTIDGILPITPTVFNTGLSIDQDLLNQYFDGKAHGAGTSTKWTFDNPLTVGAPNFCAMAAAVPEPGTYALVLVGVVVVAAGKAVSARRAVRG